MNFSRNISVSGPDKESQSSSYLIMKNDRPPLSATIAYELLPWMSTDQVPDAPNDAPAIDEGNQTLKLLLLLPIQSVAEGHRNPKMLVALSCLVLVPE